MTGVRDAAWTTRRVEEGGAPVLEIDPKEGAGELAARFPLYVLSLRMSGVIKTGTGHREVKMVGALVLQALHACCGYILHVEVAGYSKMMGWGYVLSVANSTGKLFACALFIEPRGSPSVCDAAFARLRPRDWKILGLVRVCILAMTLTASYLGVHFIVLAVAWPEMYAGYWWALPPFLVGFYLGSMPWWFGVTGHFILSSVATMLQLYGLREELEVVVADAEGTETARSWRSRALKVVSTVRLSWTEELSDSGGVGETPRRVKATGGGGEDGSVLKDGGGGDGGDGGGGTAVDDRAERFRGAHSCMDDQLQRFSYGWQFYVLVVEFLIVTIVIIYVGCLATDTWRREDYVGAHPRVYALAFILFVAVMLSTIIPLLAALIGCITFFADRLPRTVSRTAAHRRPHLAALREQMEAAQSGFYLMGSRISLGVLLSMFYLSLTTAVGVGIYLSEEGYVGLNIAGSGEGSGASGGGASSLAAATSST